jgi:hypothetical protein
MTDKTSNSEVQLAQRVLTRARKTLPLFAMILLCASVLVACGGSQAAPVGSDTGAPPAAASDSGPCDDLAIVVGDLPRAQELFAAQLETMQDEAQKWQADAQLVSLSAGCDWGQAVECVMPDGNLEAVETDQTKLEACLEGGEDSIHLDAVFYSPGTNTNWSYAERDEVIDLAEAPIDPAQIDFAKLREHLAKAGYGDEMVLPIGVSVAVPIDWSDGSAQVDEGFTYSLMAYPPGDDTNLKTLDVSGRDGTVTEATPAS